MTVGRKQLLWRDLTVLFLKTDYLLKNTNDGPQVMGIEEDRFWLNTQRINSSQINCSTPLSVALKAIGCAFIALISRMHGSIEKSMMVFLCHTEKEVQCSFWRHPLLLMWWVTQWWVLNIASCSHLVSAFTGHSEL